MFQCAIKVENPPEKENISKKPFSHLPITTPWKYKVPSNSLSNKSKLKNYFQRTTMNNEHIRQPDCNFYKYNIGSNFEKQYYNFLRLMHLFPSVHPANIHGILTTCNYDFFRAADKLRRAIRLVKGSYRPQINYMPQSFPKFHNKYYCYNRNLQHFRNYNLNVPLKPDTVYMMPNYYAGPKMCVKYENISKSMYL